MEDPSPISFVSESDLLVPRVPIPPRHFLSRRPVESKAVPAPFLEHTTTSTHAPAPAVKPVKRTPVPTKPRVSDAAVNTAESGPKDKIGNPERRAKSQASAAVDRVVQRRVEKRDERMKTREQGEKEPKNCWSKVLDRLYYHGLFQRIKQTEGFKAAENFRVTDAELRVDLAVARLDHKYHPIDTRKFKQLLARRLALAQHEDWQDELAEIRHRVDHRSLLLEDSDY